MFDFDQDMKLTFLEEAQALLDDAEAAFMAVDGGDHSPDLIDKIFRLAHNFKSSAKTVGLKHLSDFGHTFEDVLTKIKKGTLVPDKNVCTILLKTLDHFKSYVAGLVEDLTYQHDITEITAILVALDGSSEETLELTPEQILESGFVFESETPAVSAVSNIESLAIAHDQSIIPAEATPPLVTPEISQGDNSAPPSATQKKKPAEEENLKVSRRKLDGLLNLIGELVVNQSMIAGHKAQGSLASDMSLQTLNAMEKLVYEIQDISMSLRMVPVTPLFQKLKRIARDASGSMEKTIQFVTIGEDVEVDKMIVEKISDPLTHLVRNAVDHGIETDDERKSVGKKTNAVITLSAQQKEDRILITLSDNGRGMNAKKLIDKAVEKGLIPLQNSLSDENAYNLIFMPGFSTKEQITDMSGRGVGMDVVQRAIDDLRGTIQIQTKLGEGSQFIISLPLSMSIIAGMVVGIQRQKYVVPISQLVETVEFNQYKIETSTGRGRMFNLRGEVIPIYSLANFLQRYETCDSEPPKAALGLIAIYQGKKVSFEIDHIFGQQQIVLKKLGHEVQGLPGIVAGAILSTGEPGLVLNLTDFIDKGVPHAA